MSMKPWGVNCNSWKMKTWILLVNIFFPLLLQWLRQSSTDFPTVPCLLSHCSPFCFWIIMILSALCGVCWSFLATVDQSARQSALCFWRITFFVSYCQRIYKAPRHIFVKCVDDENILDNCREATSPATGKWKCSEWILKLFEI